MMRRSLPGVAIGVALVVGLLAATVGAWAPTSGASGAGYAQDPVTTTTLLVIPDDVGRIIPTPDLGEAPDEAGAQRGTQQVVLFVVLLVVITAMALFVWWRSKVARDRRRAAGSDPLDVARRRGADTRAPRDPTTPD